MSALRPPRLAAASLAAALLALAAPAHALRVATWNLLQYPNNILATRQPNFRTVMAGLDPDVLIVQEIQSQAGRDSFLTNVLNVVQPGEWSATNYIYLGSGEGSVVFYKPALVSVTNLSSIATGGPRDVLACVVHPVGYSSNLAAFRLYSLHFKAGDTASDAATRASEAAALRNAINVVNTGVIGPNFVLGGDTNLYAATEQAYLRLTESQADNDGRCKDPLLMPGNWHVNSSYGLYDTQCPCNSGCLTGFSGGGMDDRFDVLMTSYSMQDGQGVDLVPAAYAAYGNDGQHFDTDINGGGFNNAVGLTIANALHDASDHLPVFMIVQLASKVVAASSLDFGTVITGADARQVLAVQDGATPPADGLDYSYAPPPGFTAPAGGLVAAAGAAANQDTILMDTGSAGTRAGTLVMTTDAPDSLTKNVLLSGTVLRHAVASLDSATVVTAVLVDLGEHEAGAFDDQPVRVHDQGWDALQAKLEVTAAGITGGDGRFSIVGGFSPVEIAGIGHTWSVRFDADGATTDSTYEATLTFSGADEALPGSAPASDLVVTLRARPLAGPTGVPGTPTALRFEPPRPNPMTASTRFAFELPRPAHVDLSIYDLSGRRVTVLVSGTLDASRHELAWRGTDAAGRRLAAGLYFARFRTPGLERLVRLVLLP